MSFLIHAQLAKRYNQSDTYYYSKTLNEFIEKQRSSQVINFHYLLNCAEDQECLKRFYQLYELVPKMQLLTEYYKFHNEIPRCFQEKISDTLSIYHDKKRRIDFFRIKRMIENENKLNPQQPQKKIIGEEPQASDTQQSCHHYQYSNILGEINEVSRTISLIQEKLKSIKLNVGDLQLSQSNREQEQLSKFIQYLLNKKKKKINVLSTQSAAQLKLPLGLSQKTVKQMISRKILINENKSSKKISLYTQPPVFSPRLNGKQQQIKIGSYTCRTLKDENPLQKLLSPLVSVSTSKTTNSMTRSFKTCESVKSLFHQHTKTEFKIVKRH